MLTPQQITELRAKAGVKAPAAPVQTPESRIAALRGAQTYLQRVSSTQQAGADIAGGAYKQGAEDIKKNIADIPSVAGIKPGEENTPGGNTKMGLAGVSALGHIAGDIAGTVAGVGMGAAKAAIAPISQIKTAQGDTFGERFGNPIKGKIEKGVQTAQDRLKTLDPEKTYLTDPNVQKGVGDVVNTTGLTGAGKILGAEMGSPIKAATAVAKDASTAAQDVVSAVKNIKMPTPSEQAVQKAIVNKFQKGVKPLINSRQTPATARAYKEDIVSAVESIKNNKDNLSYADDGADGTIEAIKGQTPQNPQQLSDALEQTKKSIFVKYDALAKKAGKAGVSVDMNPIAAELETVINNKGLQLTNPQAIEYAQKAKARYEKVGELDAVTAQDVVQNYNKSLEAFYRNPSYDTASQAAIDAMLANRIRKALDEGISGLTGEEYGALKREYGSLKNIERDVIKAALRDGRKNVKGLIDYTDIFSGGQVVSGILTLNPQAVAVGLASKGIAEFYKYLNNPNRAIKSMFESAEDLPQSKIPRDGIQEPKNSRLQTNPAPTVSNTPAINSIDSSIPKEKPPVKSPKEGGGGPETPKGKDSERGFVKNPVATLFNKEDPGFEGFSDLSLTTLEKELKGRTTVSKQFIQDLTNKPELKQPERDVLRKVLAENEMNLYRGGGTGSMPRNATAKEVIDYETNDLGNKINIEKGVDPKKIPAKNLQWLTEDEASAKEYGEPEKVSGDFRIVARDGQGGVLVEKLSDQINVKEFADKVKSESSK